MIYITGDTHRDFRRLYSLGGKKGDMLIILGDSGINYCLDERDVELKEYLNNFGYKLFCIRGNHEERPSNIDSYIEVPMFGGKVYIEPQFPNLIFAKDGEIYEIDGKRVLVIGGAYSVDKENRIRYGTGKWFRDELLTYQEMDEILYKVKGQRFDVVLTHTCPYKYEPREVFLPFIDQNKVDKTMEHFLDEIDQNIEYDKWYCGHYHIDKEIDKIEFMFKIISPFYRKPNVERKRKKDTE